MNVSYGWLAYPLPEPGRVHSFASSNASYAKKILSWPGMGLLVYLFTASEFLIAI